MSKWLGRRLEAASPANRRIAASLCLITVLTVVARLVEAGRELVVAGTFGVSEVVDAYVIAFLVPKFLVTVVADSFAVALLPAYVAAGEGDGREASGSLLARASLRLALGLLVLVAVLAAARPIVLELLALSMTQAQVELTSSLYLLLLPVLVLNGCSRLWSMVLNAGERYALTSLAPAAVPVAGILFLLALGDSLGIQALAVGTLAGSLVEAVILGARVRSAHELTGAPDPAIPLRATVQGWWPLALSAGLMASTIPIDQFMAAGLGPGSVSTLAFGGRLVVFLVGIASMALSAALFPRYSRLVVSGRWHELTGLLRTWVRIVTMTSIPVTFTLMLLSPVIVAVLFQRGDFSTADTDAVAGVQVLYLLQVPFYLVATLCVRVLNALGRNRSLTAVASANVALNVVGNLALAPHLGVAGIALSTSLVYAVSTTVILVLVHRELARRRGSTGGGPQEDHVALAERAGIDRAQAPSPHPEATVPV